MSRFYDLLKTSGGLDPLSGASEASSQPPVLPDIDLSFLVDPVPAGLTAAAPSVSEAASTAVLEQAKAATAEELTGRPEQYPFKSEVITFPPKLPVLSNAANSAVLEYYRRLRTKILHLRDARTFRTLIITSSEPQEGKTLTTLNLGLSFAMLPSFRVAVVDADLRRGSLGGWLGAEDRPGFSNLIDGSASLHDVVYRAEEQGFYFIGRGNSTELPGELLQSSRVSGVCRRLGGEFDLVLMDSAPANVVADTHLLVAHCDAVLMIARAFATTKKAFEKATQEVEHSHIIGTVLNGATRPRSYRGYKGYGSYY